MSTPESSIAALQSLVEKHWIHHGHDTPLDWSVFRLSNGLWVMQIAPSPLNATATPWTPFEFDLGRFVAEPGLAIEEFGVMSDRDEYDNPPFVMIQGEYQQQPFVMNLYLEPISAPVGISVVTEGRTNG